MTGSDDIYVSGGNGLGVVGGAGGALGDTRLNSGESMEFLFQNGPVQDVYDKYKACGINISTGDNTYCSEHFVEAFDENNQSLGMIASPTRIMPAPAPMSGIAWSLDDIYGDVLVSRFVLTAVGFDDEYLRIGQVQYTGVPLPAPVWFFSGGMAWFWQFRRRSSPKSMGSDSVHQALLTNQWNLPQWFRARYS